MAAVTEAACLRRRARLLGLVILSSGIPPVYSSETAGLGAEGVGVGRPDRSPILATVQTAGMLTVRSSSPGLESELG